MAPETPNTAKKSARVLPDLAASAARIAELEAALAAATAAKAAGGKVTIKLSAKGAVSVYGLQRWPVTLYAGQWVQFLDQTKDGAAIRKFIADNKLPLEKPTI